MKPIIGFLSLAALFSVSACSDNKPTEVKKEVIVVPAPKTQATVVTAPPPKNTTIVLDKNGVQVGTKKVDVTIKPGQKVDN